MKLKSFFQYALTVALLALVGTTAFAQQTFTTVYDNGGKSIRGDFRLIGNRSDAGYNLNIPTIDGCPSTVQVMREEREILILYVSQCRGDRVKPLLLLKGILSLKQWYGKMLTI